MGEEIVYLIESLEKNGIDYVYKETEEGWELVISVDADEDIFKEE